MTVFRDRADAGKRLAGHLSKYKDQLDVLVLALPRGGVPVGFEVATALNAPLDVFLVRKLGLPGHEELAMGAIASGGVTVLNEDVVRMNQVPESTIESVAARQRAELERRELTYGRDRKHIELRGKSVIIVDDGLATGATMRAAVAAVRQQRPARIIVAVPTAPPDTCRSFRDQADEVICVITPQHFAAVGYWYSDFSQTTDQEVRELLDRADRRFRQDLPLPSQEGESHEQQSPA